MSELGSTVQMTESERIRISRFIEHEFGIKMPEAKKSLLEGRLKKRLDALGFSRFGDYFDFATQDPEGQGEFLYFADLVSTHETSFFREDKHFVYLRQAVLPELLDRNEGPLRILSAACSTGEEAYTLGMVIDSTIAKRRRGGPDFTIEGVDLSHRAVEIATRGVYLANRVQPIPSELRVRYLMTSKDRHKDLVRFVPELRIRMAFHSGNLLGSLNLAQRSYDIVFCRNVLIYFDLENQRRVLSTLLDFLRPQGWLFLGHSESMIGFHLPVRPVSNAVFRRT